MQTFEELSEATWGEHRWCAASKVEGGDRAIREAAIPLCLLKNGLDKGALISISGRVLVERAIRANPVAERDVDVDNQFQVTGV